MTKENIPLKVNPALQQPISAPVPMPINNY